MMHIYLCRCHCNDDMSLFTDPSIIFDFNVNMNIQYMYRTCNGKSNSGHTLSKPLQPQVQGSPERSHDSHHVPSLHSHGHSLEEKLVGPLLPSCLPEAVSEVPEQLEGLWAQHSKLDHFALRHFCTPELRDLNGRDTSWLALTTVLLSYRLRGGQYYCI